MRRDQGLPNDMSFRDFSRTVSPEDRTATGKALRNKVPRAQHGAWKEEKGRPDPIGILQRSDEGRVKDFVAIKYGRMLQSPLAFYRGAAAVMAADLARGPATGLRVQACGDCHLLNFGGFATPERNVVFDINDFDETLPAPWEWDVKRLAASIVLAARMIGLSDTKGRDLAVAGAQSYRARLAEFSKTDPLRLWHMSITADDFLGQLPQDVQKGVRKRIDKKMAREGTEVGLPKLAGAAHGQIRIREQPPSIFHPQEALVPEFQDTLEEVFNCYRKILGEDQRVLLDRFRIVDAAIKLAGLGSIGRRCWVALLMSEGNTTLFLQFKEAVESVLEPYAGKSSYGHHGQRVVVGQRLMQPASDRLLGWMTAPSGRQFYVRQLHDAKIKPLIEEFNAEILDLYARACGWVLARAHARTGDSSVISSYLGSSSDEFDEAIGDFALAYADQTERDQAVLKAAVRKGKIIVQSES